MYSKIISYILILLSLQTFAQEVSEKNTDRKQMVELMDKKKLLSQTTAVIIETKKVLKIPKTIHHFKNGFTVAKKTPVIEFAIIPIEERFQPDPPKGYVPTLWSSWGQGVYSENTKNYYAAYGNHRLNQARIFIAEYDSESKSIRNSPEINKGIGRNLKDGLGDGKIHGWLGLSNNEIYFYTYWGFYPRPLEKHFQAGYDGGHIGSYNIYTKKITDYGLAMPRVSWPYHYLDAKRGLMFAVGMFGEFSCFDLNKNEVRFAGFPPEGIVWNKRAMLVDDKTGMVYTTNSSVLDSASHFIKYNPVTNSFNKMKSAVLPNIESGNLDRMRAHTVKRSKDGWFIGVTSSNSTKPAGQLFKFYPDEDRVENLGICWEGIQRYTTSLALSPDEKYLYYLPGAHGRSHLEGSPVVQYNVLTGERKILAFLFPYLYNQFGYVTGGSFSVDIDEEGKRLFICINGRFIDYEKIEEDIFGDPSILVINIPASERE